MVASIPASAIVNVTPSVISAGGLGLSLSGLILTNSTRVPVGTVQPFATAAAVAAYFGPSSAEAAAASVYFLGFDNSSVKPAQLLFSQYPSAPVAAYLRGGSVAALTLAQLQALTGTLTLQVGTTSVTSSAINLSAATSFSNAATIIQAAFTTPGFAVTYDAQSGGFLFTSTATGATAIATFATGTLSVPLALTAATGAVTSQGAIAGAPAAAMTAIVAQTQNFASFTTLFEPVTADCVAFAAWTNTTNDRFMYVCWDTDVTVTTVNNTSSAGYLITQAAYDGTFLLYCPDYTKAVFVLSIGASLDYTRANDKSTFAFRAQAGLTADVTNQQIAAQLIANGYNFYGAYGTAASTFVWLYNGSVTGRFLWADDYVNQIQLNSAFQLALMTLLQQAKSLPYNTTGYGKIEAALLDPINAALLFGSIHPGVNLSNAQISAINAAAGIDCAAAVASRGWYLAIQPASATVRAARASPPCTFIYTSGQSVQTINLLSVEAV